MTQARLFPSELPTCPWPGEPSVWLKRLVIVRERTAGQVPIRDIEFRLGLNVIRTKDEANNDAAAAGHNVGKTLLVRLLRYCLGDGQYANSNTRSRIRDVLSDGWVIALVRVAGTTWGVARPLGPSRHSWCLSTENWQDMLADTAGLRPYAELQVALEKIVLSC